MWSTDSKLVTNLQDAATRRLVKPKKYLISCIKQGNINNQRAVSVGLKGIVGFLISENLRKLKPTGNFINSVNMMIL